MSIDELTAQTTPMVAGRRRSRLRLPSRDRVVAAVLIALVLAVFLAGWQLAAVNDWVNPLFFSRPTLVAAALRDGFADGTLLHALASTLYETVTGFVIASVAGVVAAVVLHQLPLLNRVVRPYLTMFNNLPRLALAPVFVLWFGVGDEARIVLVISFVFFIIVLSTHAGLDNSDRDRLLLAKALGAGRVEKFVKFQLPDAVPAMFAGFQLGLTYSFLGAVVGEMLTGGDGIGAAVSVGLATYRTDQVFAEIIVMAVVATALSGIIRISERRLLGWRRFELRGLAQP